MQLRKCLNDLLLIFNISFNIVGRFNFVRLLILVACNRSWLLERLGVGATFSGELCGFEELG